MKTKNNSNSPVNLKLLLVVPAIFLVLISFSYCAVKKTHTLSMPSDQEEIPFVVVEEMPIFPGGDSTLLAYLGQNTRYPESAKNNKIQGRVIVRFCVTASGGVNRISILKGVNPELDAEASRVVSTLPEFKPGKQGGKNVPVWYMVPIEFSLK